jgi:hypothetical protein
MFMLPIPPQSPSTSVDMDSRNADLLTLEALASRSALDADRNDLDETTAPSIVLILESLLEAPLAVWTLYPMTADKMRTGAIMIDTTLLIEIGSILA